MDPLVSTIPSAGLVGAGPSDAPGRLSLWVFWECPLPRGASDPIQSGPRSPSIPSRAIAPFLFPTRTYVLVSYEDVAVGAQEAGQGRPVSQVSAGRPHPPEGLRKRG